MAMNIVEINVTGSTVTGGGANVGAAGSHHDVALRITFDSEWDNLSKKILWQNSRGLNTVYTLLDSGFLAEGETRVYLVPIPSEPKEFAGNMQFSVKGFSETNGSITIAYTASCTFVVSPSINDGSAEEAEETKTASISEQLQAKIDNLISDVGNLQTEKVDKEQGKGLSTNDFTNDDKSKLDDIEADAEVNDVTSVAGKTGAVILVKGDVGLPNVDNTSDMDKPISAAAQGALNTKADASDVAAIQSKIPSQATSDNQLADKDFVNSSIATETAHYISNNGEPFTSVAQLEAYSGTVTNNDYAFVTGTDSAGNTYYDKYKATVTSNVVSWAKEYRLNNSSFTAAQWAAIMSGITSALVNQITENQQAILTMAQSIANKVDKEQGKGLSTNDFTNADKSKLDDIETGAEVNAVDDVEQNGESVVDGNKVAHIDAYKKEDALSIMCPQTETTDLVISDAISHNVIDYTIYGNAGGVGDLVVDGDDDYAEHGGEYRIPITVRGKNLFDISKNTQGFVNITYGGLTNTYNDDHTVLTTNSSSGQGRSGLFSLGAFEAGTYYISAKFNRKSGTANGGLIAKNGSVTNNNYPGAITITGTTELQLYYSFKSSDSPYTLSEVQIEKGSSGTPYKPYFERTVNIYLDSPLSEGQSVSLSETNVPFMLDGNDTNTITFATAVQPSSVKIKYYQDINKVIANLQALILNQ